MVYISAGANVIIFDPKTNLTSTITTGALPRGLAVDPDTGRIYVADEDSNDLIAINSDGSGSSTIGTGTQPIDVAVNPATDQIYVANVGSDDLTVVDGKTFQTTSIGLGATPLALAVNPATDKVYVIGQDNSLIVVDGSAAVSPSGTSANLPGAATNAASANSSTAAGMPAAQTVVNLAIGQTGYTVNGAVYTLDTAPLIYEGRTLVPIRDVASALGASVNWEAADQKVTVSLNGKTLELWIGQSTAMVNGVAVPIDPGNLDVVPTLAPPGRVMLPLRFIAENLGCQVDWNPSLQEIRLTFSKP
jgi:YVTN family beta-propeller protein